MSDNDEYAYESSGSDNGNAAHDGTAATDRAMMESSAAATGAAAARATTAAAAAAIAAAGVLPVQALPKKVRRLHVEQNRCRQHRMGLSNAR